MGSVNQNTATFTGTVADEATVTLYTATEMAGRQALILSATLGCIKSTTDVSQGELLVGGTAVASAELPGADDTEVMTTFRDITVEAQAIAVTNTIVGSGTGEDLHYIVTVRLI